MPDKYTELAREFINEYDPGGEYYLDDLAALLRQAASRELTDAADTIYGLKTEIGEDDYWGAKKQALNWLRSRAKELEPNPRS